MVALHMRAQWLNITGWAVCMSEITVLKKAYGLDLIVGVLRKEETAMITQ